MVKITPCVGSKLQSSTTACLSQRDVNDKLQQAKGNYIPPVGVVFVPALISKSSAVLF